MNMQPSTEQSFRNILDTFTGSDGGVRFVRFKVFIASVDEKLRDGDSGAEKIIEILHLMSRMIDVANKKQET